MRAALSNFGTDAPAFAQLNQHLSALAGLQRRIGSATIMDLIAVRGEVAAVVTQAQSAAASAQSAGGNAATQLQLASGATRQATKDFLHGYYDKHEFDDYLEFASKNEEEEFRKREAERRAEIEKALALNTPEGNLRASNLSIDQLKDAGAHGADRSPAYASLLHQLESSRDALSAGVASATVQDDKQRRAVAAISPDVSDAAAAPDALAAIAKLRAQVVLTDEQQAGHGLSTGKVSRATDAPLPPSH